MPPVPKSAVVRGGARANKVPVCESKYYKPDYMDYTDISGMVFEFSSDQADRM